MVNIVPTLAIASSLASWANAGCARGLAWGVDWSYARGLGSLPLTSWYHGKCSRVTMLAIIGEVVSLE